MTITEIQPPAMMALTVAFAPSMIALTILLVCFAVVFIVLTDFSKPLLAVSTLFFVAFADCFEDT